MCQVTGVCVMCVHSGVFLEFLWCMLCVSVKCVYVGVCESVVNGACLFKFLHCGVCVWSSVVTGMCLHEVYAL